MKIVFLTSVKRKISGKTIYEDALGGTHSAMVNLASELALLNHQVYIFSNCNGEEGIYENVEYLISNKIISFFKENEVDIFICVASEAALKVRLKAKKTITWLHNDYSPYWNNELSDVASQISGYMSVRSDKVVTVSKWQTNIIKDVLKIPENHIKIISNGVKLSNFSDNISHQKKKLIYSSAPDRGLDLLLEFFPEIKEKINDVELHIYSSFKTWGKDDPNYKRIEKEIVNKSEYEGIFFHDVIPADKLAKELQSSYLWVYPNHQSIETYFYAETFCISALEAMAAGLPVITSERGALPELIENNKTGILISGEPYSEEYKANFISETVKLLNDEDLWQKLSENARQRSELYSWKKIALEWNKLFDDLINENISTKLQESPLKPLFPYPEVSIIIPTYNRADNLKYSLNALTWQNFKNFEVIIADDGSTDNTREVVDSFRDRLNIRYAYAGKNQGFRAARTRNIGLQKARGKLIVFLDSDIITPPTYLEEHIKAHKKAYELIVNSFVYRMKEYNEEDLGIPPKEFIEKHKDNLNDDIKHEFNVFDREPIEEGYFLDSNSFSIKAEHILNEGFDASFVGWGHEDTELGYRFSQKFFKFMFIKNNCESYHIYHYVSPEKDAETKINWQRLAKKYHLKKWYHPIPKLEVEGDIILENIDLEKLGLFSNNIPAKFEIKVGDKFNGFTPFFKIKVN